MSNHKYFFLLLILFVGSGLVAQNATAHSQLRAADKAYEQGDYETAAKLYEEALRKENSVQGNYNLGNTDYHKGDYEAAARRYQEAARLAQDPTARSKALHNLGNAFMQQEETTKAIEAYRDALRSNPDDLETRHNLGKAMQLIRQQQQQQQQQQQNEQQEQQNEEQQEQDQPQQQPQDNTAGEEDQPQQQEQPQDQNQDPSQNQEQQQQSAMTREEALRQLEYAEEAEKRTRQKLQQVQGRSCNSDKEW